MGRRAVFVLCALACVCAIPTDKLTGENVDEPVGLSKFEAEMMFLSADGVFELAFTPQDVKTLLGAVHPFGKFDEGDESVVLMDKFPYIPLVKVDEFNTTFRLSNLKLQQTVDPNMIDIQFREGWQSIYFVDIPMNATFDFEVKGNTPMSGSAMVRIPHAWVHQNVEAACSHDLASLLSWEGRVDLYIQGVDIQTASTNMALIDAFAAAIHTSKDVRSYIGNAVQHQLALFLGTLHWKTQFRMRDLCLQCHYMRYSNTSLIVAFKGDTKCMGSIPGLFFQGLDRSKITPLDLQPVAVEAIKHGLLRQFRSTNDHTNEQLETQALGSVEVGKHDIDQLKPRVDPRAKYHKQEKVGYVKEEPAVASWAKKLGQMWMNFKGIRPTNATA